MWKVWGPDDKTPVPNSLPSSPCLIPFTIRQSLPAKHHENYFRGVHMWTVSYAVSVQESYTPDNGPLWQSVSLLWCLISPIDEPILAHGVGLTRSTIRHLFPSLFPVKGASKYLDIGGFFRTRRFIHEFSKLVLQLHHVPAPPHLETRCSTSFENSWINLHVLKKSSASIYILLRMPIYSIIFE